MRPVGFEEASHMLGPPEGVTHSKVSELPVFKGKLPTGEPMVVSCWEPTDEEILSIIRNKRIWVIEWGNVHHAMAITGIKPLEKETNPHYQLSTDGQVKSEGIPAASGQQSIVLPENKSW